MKFIILLCALFQGLFHAIHASPSPALLERLLQSRSESEPNPIASLYPNSITGTINSTLVVVPIPYALARSIVPAQWKILTKAYHELLPNLPPNTYPLVIRGVLDHGVGLYSLNVTLPDFQRIQITYPFVDLLGDGYSSFAYNNDMLISASNPIAIAGAEADGTIVAPATFSPDLEAYAHSPPSYRAPKGEIYLKAYTAFGGDKAAVSTKYVPQKKIGPWPVSFFKNVTNQPIFSNGSACDNQVNLFNTTLSTGKNEPMGIRGSAKIIEPYFPAGDHEAFKDVYGIKVDIAFVEFPGSKCSDLKGYHASGSGD